MCIAHISIKHIFCENCYHLGVGPYDIMRSSDQHALVIMNVGRMKICQASRREHAPDIRCWLVCPPDSDAVIVDSLVI